MSPHRQVGTLSLLLRSFYAMNRRFVLLPGWCVAAVLTLTLVAGCADGPRQPPVETAPVAGKVTVNGAPLADAYIEFATKDFAGTAKTDAQGKFKLAQGAAVGENKVMIKVIPEGFVEDVEGGMDLGQLEASGDLAKMNMAASPIPADYADPEKTPLKFVVQEGGTETANFDL